MLYSNKKKEITTIHNCMDKSQKRTIETTEVRHKREYALWFHLYKFQIQVTLFNDVRNLYLCVKFNRAVSCSALYVYYASIKNLKAVTHWNLYTLLWYLTLMGCNFYLKRKWRRKLTVFWSLLTHNVQLLTTA